MFTTSEVTLEGDCDVIVTRDFASPRASVWRAFTDPALLTRWLLGPPGWEMHVCEMDLSVGGGYSWRWRNLESGEEFGFTGVYSVVEPMVRIEDRQTFDQGDLKTPMGKPTKNTVVFEDIPEGTRVASRISYADQATRDLVLSQGMTDGMEMSYARLDTALPEMA